MAAKAVEKQEEPLNCSICKGAFSVCHLGDQKYLKQLQCHHVFCKNCLKRQVQQLTLICSICRHVTKLSAQGVEDLPVPFHIVVRCIMKELTPMCTQYSQQITKKCGLHSGEDLKLFCESCQISICLQCAIKGGRHFGHEYDPLDKIYKKSQEEIMSSLAPVEKELSTLGEALADFDANSEKILIQQADIKAEISETIQKACAALQAREKVLVEELEEATKDKLKPLAAQRDKAQTTQEQLNSYLQLIKSSIKPDNSLGMLKAKNTILKRTEILLQSLPSDIKCGQFGGTRLSTSINLPLLCQNYGQLSAVEFSAVKWHCIGLETDFTIQALGLKGITDEQVLEMLKCEVVSEIYGESLRATIRQRGKNYLYNVAIDPGRKERYQVTVTFNGQNIIEQQIIKFRRSSSSTSRSSSQYGQLNSLWSTGDVDAPWGVAFTRTGKIVITERGRDCVSVFSHGGKRILSFGSFGSEQGQFNLPLGVAVDGNENILVVDSNNHRIQKFTMEGEFLSAVGEKGNGDLQFYHPSGIVFNSVNDKIYVADNMNHRIQVLKSNLSFHSTFGRKGSESGQLFQPWATACDTFGQVFVADSGNERIQIFTQDGLFSKLIEWPGHYPLALAVDDGKVYVTDGKKEYFSGYKCSIALFSRQKINSGYSNSELSDQYTLTSAVCIDLDYSCGLAIDESGVMCVCDSGNNAITLL